jgi:hypothetical protein
MAMVTLPLTSVKEKPLISIKVYHWTTVINLTIHIQVMTKKSKQLHNVTKIHFVYLSESIYLLNKIT